MLTAKAVYWIKTWAVHPDSLGFLDPLVTKSKLLRLATRQANKSRDKWLGQGRGTLFGKPADREDGGHVSQRTVFPELEFRLLLH